MTHKPERQHQRPTEAHLLTKENQSARPELRRMAGTFRGTRHRIAFLFDRGMSDADIARTLGFSIGTVEEQLRKIHRKRKRALKIHPA